VVAAPGSALAPGQDAQLFPAGGIGSLSVASLVVNPDLFFDIELGFDAASDRIVASGAFNFASSGNYVVRFFDGTGGLLTRDAVVGKTYRIASFGSTNYGAVPANLRVASGDNVGYIDGTFAVSANAIDFQATAFQPVPVSPMWLTLPTGIVFLGLSRGQKRSRRSKSKA
jgi:hypothetical protein